MDDLVETLKKLDFEKFGELAEEPKNLVFSTIFFANTLNLMCARDSLNTEISRICSDNDFADTKKYSDWLEQNGISKDEKKALAAELRDYVTDAFISKDKSNDMKKIMDIVEKNFSNDMILGIMEDDFADAHSDEKNKYDVFYEVAVPYVKEVGKILTERLGQLNNANELRNRWENIKVEAFTAADQLSLHFDSTAHFWSLPNTVFEEISHDVAANMEFVNIRMRDMEVVYGKDGDVHPTDFLEHYKSSPDSLTAEEKQWAHDCYEKIVRNVEIEAFDVSSRVDWDCFKADGKQIISTEEMESARDKKSGYANENVSLMEEKIVAAMLMGKRLTAVPHNSDKEVMINPTISEPEKTKFGFGRIIKWLYDLFFNKEKNIETAKVGEMNNRFEENVSKVNNSRVKINFGELSNYGEYNKVTLPDEKEKQKTVGKNNFQK